MEKESFIPADKCSALYNVEVSFINSLHEAGLISMTTINQECFVAHEQLNDLEKFIRLHYDLEINMEGMEAIAHMLQKMKTMREEIVALRNRLKMYEP